MLSDRQNFTIVLEFRLLPICRMKVAGFWGLADGLHFQPRGCDGPIPSVARAAPSRLALVIPRFRQRYALLLQCPQFSNGPYARTGPEARHQQLAPALAQQT